LVANNSHNFFRDVNITDYAARKENTALNAFVYRRILGVFTCRNKGTALEVTDRCS